MRVCIVTSTYPRWPGDPPGLVIASLARHMADQPGIEVTVLAPGDVRAGSVERRGNLEVRRLTYFWPRAWQRLAYGAGIPWNLRHSIVTRLNVPAFLLAYAAALCQHGKRSDLIHAQWGPMGAIATITQPVHRRPVLVTIHGSDWQSRIPPVRWATRWAVRHADAVTSPSQEFVEELRAMRADRASCVWVPNGVEFPSLDDLGRRPDSEPAAEQGYRLISVGRLIPERRHDLLVRVLARLRASYPVITLTLVGDGPCAGDLERLIADLGVGDAVRLTGTLPNDEVLRRLGEADLYVSSTTVECFGGAVLEAAAYSLPIVTTRVGYPVTMVADGVTGRVVPPEDEDAFVKAVDGILANRDELRRAGRRQRDRVKDLGLTCDIVTRKYMDLYRKVCAEWGAAGSRD